MRPNWLRVVSFKTELLTEVLTHRGYREDLQTLLPVVGLLRNRMIIDNDIYVDLNEVGEVQNILRENLQPLAQDAYERIEEQSRTLIQTANELPRDNLNALELDALIEGLERFFEEYKKCLGMIGIPTIIDLTLEKATKEHLKTSGVANPDVAFAALAVPVMPVSTSQERLGLIQIALARKDGGEIDDLVFAHAREYGWLYSTLFMGEPYTPEQVFAQLELIRDPSAELQALLTQRDGQREQADFVIAQVQSETGKSLAKFMQSAVYFRTARLEWMNMACFLARPLLGEVAARLELRFDDVIYLAPDEIFSYLKAGVPATAQDIIAQRKVGYAFVSDNEREYKLFVGEELARLKDHFRSAEVTSTEVKGTVASKGIARGVVTVVRDRSEMSKVKDGDVLVTPLTTPDFIGAMKKSVAVVTDLGGLTSHAAIVCRELGLPCIVGSKIATQALKDGDVVEVDADRGVVRIISKHE